MHLERNIPAKEDRKRVRAIEDNKRLDGWTEVSRARNVRNSDLYRELCRYQEEGIELWLNGEPSTSYQIAYSVCETSNYMRDYYMDGQNRVCGIGFDKIGKDGGFSVPLMRKLKKL